MKRIALVVPGTKKEYAVQEPLNLGYLASFLEDRGFEVSIIDQLAGQNVENEIKKFKPDAVGITGVTPVIPEAYKIADWAKSEGYLTILGGVHVSIMPEEGLKHADIVVVGEGENALLEIMQGKHKKGIVKGELIRNIDEIPSPARHLMQADFYIHTKDRLPRTYLGFVSPNMRAAALFTSRGCPWNCTFCHNTWRGTPFRYNSPERVISEIKDLINNYKVEAIFFIEDNLFANLDRLKKICNLIIENDLKFIWGANARVNNINPEILDLAKSAGCRQITFGFESGSQKVLDILNKKTNVEQNKRAVEMCRAAGLAPLGTFMIGTPYETREDIKKTRDFIRKNKLDNIGVCITTAFPGTEIWNWCEKNNRIPKNINWAEFNYLKAPIKISDLSEEELEMWRVYCKNPLNFWQSLIKIYARHPFKTIKKAVEAPSRIKKVLKNKLF